MTETTASPAASTQEAILEATRAFVRDEVAPVAAQMDRDDVYPAGLMRRCAELGLTGILFPEEYGGLGLGLGTFCEVLEEISTATQTLAITLDASATLCFMPILEFGTEEQRQRYLPRAARGEIIGAIAGTERTGAFNFAAFTSTAVRDGDDWIINGEKIYITNAQAADVYLFFARVDDNPMATCFIVEKGTPGLSFGALETKLGWHGNNSGTVICNDVRVPAHNLLGEAHGGFAGVLGGIAQSMVGIGAMCVGAAAGAAKRTLDRVVERNLYGSQLIDVQGVYDTIARMAIEIETSRALVYKTAAAIDEGNPPTVGSQSYLMASACKVQPPEMAAKVCDWAIQLHGGSGYMDGGEIHRYWRDVRACQIGEGPTYFHLHNIAGIVRTAGAF